MRLYAQTALTISDYMAKVKSFTVSPYPMLPCCDNICALPLKIGTRPWRGSVYVDYRHAPLHAFRVILEWGFKYIKAVFQWVKCNRKVISIKRRSFWGQKSIEICLLGRKGKWAMKKHLRLLPDQLIFGHAQNHSQKPGIFQDEIEGMFPEAEKSGFSQGNKERVGWYGKTRYYPAYNSPNSVPFSSESAKGNNCPRDWTPSRQGSRNKERKTQNSKFFGSGKQFFKFFSFFKPLLYPLS